MRTDDERVFIEDFDQLLAREQRLLQKRRTARGIDPDEPGLGLALSSGGMRAAAFGLGVMRALHERGVYDRLDYISSVSSGGFCAAFASWLRRRGSGVHPQAGELLPAPALRFERQNADYMHPAARAEEQHDAQRAPRPETLFAVVLGQTLLSLTVYGSLLVGMFFLLSIGDALVTLQKPILLLASRNETWRFLVSHLNFGSVAALVVLGAGALRKVGALLGYAGRLIWASIAPGGAAPTAGDAWKGSLYFLLGLVTAALSIMALSMLETGLAAWFGALLFAALSAFSFRRCERHWNARVRSCEAGTYGAVHEPASGAWLILPWLAASLVSLTLLGLFANYLLLSGHAPVGDPARLPRAGGVLALFISLAWTVWLVPRALRSLGRTLANLRDPGDQRASYQRTLLRQHTSGTALTWAAFWLALGSIPWLEDLTQRALGSRVLHTYLFGTALALATLLICARVVSPRASSEKRRKRLSRAWINVLMGLWLYGVLALAHGVTTTMLDSSLPQATLLLVAVGVALGALAELNFAGAGWVYRNRLAETFLPDARAIDEGRWLPALQASDFPLAELSAAADHDPYLLLNASLITDGSKRRPLAQRGCDSFVFSALFCGSAATGWLETQRWQRGRLTLRDALTVSSAAVAPGAASERQTHPHSRLLAAARQIFNLRLYYCADNPNPRHCPHPGWLRPNLLVPGLRSLLSGPAESETSRHVRLSDGAHFEPLGLYELLRRKLELIIVADATEDPQRSFAALGDAVERAREDLGVVIELDPGRVFGGSAGAGLYGTSETLGLAARGFAVGTIRYGDAHPAGTLIYVKPTLVGGLDVALRSFAAEHPSFPSAASGHRPFGEHDFVAYEQLGRQIGLRALDEGMTRESADLESVRPARPESFIQFKGNLPAVDSGTDG